MPPALPDRYQLEVRLGRDVDIEEWLALDTALDRPVLIRVLGPDASPDRRASFLDAVRGAAQVSHLHLASIYSAGQEGDSTYSVSEWVGGVTLADRTAAREPIPPEEFVPNAAGLADALAALHQAGQIHGALDAQAIFFSAAHPAKIGGFGRPRRTRFATDDVEALASALEHTLTGREPGSVPPSQVVDRLSPIVDGALSEARTGMFDAGALASALHTAPSSPTRQSSSGWSWRWIVPAIVLGLVAVTLVAYGASLVRNADDALAIPNPTGGGSPSVTPSSTTPPAAPPSTVSAPGTVLAVGSRSFDPFGDNEEHQELASAAIDGDFGTAWKTESYLDPLPRQKPGVGLMVDVQGSPSGVEITGVRDGTVWELHWSAEPSAPFDDWVQVSNGTVRGGSLNTDFQVRGGGSWLIWFTDLPASNDGTYNSTIAEVRFRP